VTTANEEIQCNFTGDFKVGDNLVLNAAALRALVDANKNGVLNKLILVQAAAIVEAALGQIIYRAQKHNIEGVPEMSEEDRSAIEGKKVDNFNNIVAVMKKHKILDELGVGIYDELDNLRKYRNKIHIYLDVGITGVSRNEDTAFSSDIVNWALKLNVRILKYLSQKRPRPKELDQYAQPLSVPSP
jgi:hypothetical protein